MEKRIGNYLIQVVPDESAIDPRDWDNLSTMVCFHRRYDLGDKHNYDHNDYSGWEEMKSAIIKNEKPVVILPLYLYDHSGITISTSPFSCRWDSGQIGFVFVTREKAVTEFQTNKMTKKVKEDCLRILESEVKTYDQYLVGDVYGYKVYEISTCDQGHEHKKMVESCYGYYGEAECMEEAESVYNYIIENKGHEVLND
jgi:hypothetical protein